MFFSWIAYVLAVGRSWRPCRSPDLPRHRAGSAAADRGALTGTMLTAMLALVCGIVLHTVTLGRQEAKRLRYLAIPGVATRDAT